MARFLVLAFLLLVSCTATPDAGTHVHLQPMPPDFVAVTTHAASLARVHCPGGTTPHLRCESTGVQLTQPPADLTVKARGFAFATQPVAAGVSTVALHALPAAVLTVDYATGVATTDAFQQLAWPAQTELGPVHAVKFYIRHLHTTPEIYLQNTKKHPLHFAFAHDVLGELESVGQFEAATYAGDDRDALAGTLLWYPDVKTKEFAAPVALTFFPSDSLTPQLALRAHVLLEERLGFVALVGPTQRLVYLPAGTVQEAQLTAQKALFAGRDAAWLLRSDLYAGVTLQILNAGVAYGTLRRIAPADLATTIVSYADLLVLPELPNELPLVGGTISETLQTPLAHVSVAARTRGTPNMALLGAGDDPRVGPFLGKLVRFEVTATGFDVRAATLEEAQAFWNTKKKPPFVPVHDDAPTGLIDLADLHFADAIRVGVKAANVAELSRLLGDHAPHGFAVPFGAYLHMLQTTAVTADTCAAAQADCLNAGRAAAVCGTAEALCLPQSATETLATHLPRVLADAQFAADSALREAELDSIAWHVRNTTVDPLLAQALDARVAAVFGTARVRMRSSTNAEDLPGFSGAGLYNSFGADASGPQAASLRVRDTWASVWNWRAFEERNWWNIDHLSVRMGVLVHESFPDERANGVLITQNIADPVTAGFYVNVQLGEASVTNPLDGQLAEVFSIVPSPAGYQVARQRFSNLSPGVPILTDAEVTALAATAQQVQGYFAPLYGKDASVLALDIEFKFHGPERQLYFKQVRPYTQAALAP